MAKQSRKIARRSVVTLSRRPTPHPTPAQRRWHLVAIASVLAITALFGLLIWLGLSRPQIATNRPLGSVNCPAWPAFATRLGFEQDRTLISTRDTATIGLLLSDPEAADIALHSYQEPSGSWSQAGNLGPYVLDGSGAIYVAPVPKTSLTLNPPDKQNTLYRVDPTTGIMSAWASIPAGAPARFENVYGLMGLAVDCATNSLYAASLAGSTQAQELGRVVRIDLRSKQITSQLDNVDAIGLGVYVTKSGPRLYLGRARSGTVQSILLDTNGNFASELRDEFSIDDQVDDAYARVRRFMWRADGSAVLTVVPFTYTLDNGDASLQLLYRYDPSTDDWQFADLHRN